MTKNKRASEINKQSEAEGGQQEMVYACPECSAGVMRLNHITYFTWLNDELITAPNFPAWICDLCGRRDFDPRAVTWLNTLLNPSAGRSTGRRSGLNSRPTGKPIQP